MIEALMCRREPRRAAPADSDVRRRGRRQTTTPSGNLVFIVDSSLSNPISRLQRTQVKCSRCAMTTNALCVLQGGRGGGAPGRNLIGRIEHGTHDLYTRTEKGRAERKVQLWMEIKSSMEEQICFLNNRVDGVWFDRNDGVEKERHLCTMINT